MSKLMIAMPSDKTPPLYDFFNDELNEKQRQKLLSLFALMLQAPVSVMREPYSQDGRPLHQKTHTPLPARRLAGNCRTSARSISP